METHLVEAARKHPDYLDWRSEQQLRYALSFARLTAFQPGAATKGGRTNGRQDVDVAEEPVLRVRGDVLDHLEKSLHAGLEPRKRLKEARMALPHLLPILRENRRRLLEIHASDFSARELDDEVGKKTLVSVAGGGGGAGYVYIGAYEALDQAGITPGYIIGASIGAVIGLFRAKTKKFDFDADVALAKSLKFDDVFRFVSVKVKYGLPGLMRLFLHAGIQKRFTLPEGRWMHLPDLQIPYEAIVAGVWKGAMKNSPEEYGRAHHLNVTRRPSRLALGRMIAEQLVRMVAFFNPMLVKEIVIGGDELTSTFDAVDAAGFSAAVPGILHYDVARNDSHMHQILDELLKREEVSCLIDGGVANNVPVRTAWHQVQGGKIGTRNCIYLGFDCFHPSWALRHVWLQAITRIVQLQVAANRPYAHEIVQFSPTLSPANLLPRAEKIDRAVGWGRDQMKQHLSLVRGLLEPVEWVE